jgi:hypothetical protein
VQPDAGLTLSVTASTSTTSSGSGNVRLLALDFGVPVRIVLPTVTRFSALRRRLGGSAFHQVHLR